MSGIKAGRVEVSCLFLLLCACLLYQDASGIVCLGLLACLLHEAGHFTALLQSGNNVKRICITAFGAKIITEKPMGYWQELFVAAAGPCVNLALAYLFSKVPEGAAFAGVNLALGVFNLLPVGELDGARVLRSALSCLIPGEIATMISWCLGFSFTVVFAGLGVVFALRYQNLTMLLMSLWLMKRPTREKTLSF